MDGAGEVRPRMKRYGLIFMDADETLFDFVRAEAFALSSAFGEAGLSFDESAAQLYDAINKDCWRRFERGELDQATLKTERFGLLFASLGLEVDPARFGRSYLAWLARASFLLEGAEEVCAYLAGRYRLVLLTNGIAGVQRPRFAASSIRRFFEAIVISGEVGYAKPDPRIFDCACDLVGFHDKSRILMVGDSLSSDIAGGAAFGIDTCWFNPRGLPRVPGLDPSYETAELSGLRTIL